MILEICDKSVEPRAGLALKLLLQNTFFQRLVCIEQQVVGFVEVHRHRHLAQSRNSVESPLLLPGVSGSKHVKGPQHCREQCPRQRRGGRQK